MVEELKRLRTARGWSQQKLADVSGVNKATINQVEQGKRSPSMATLENLARAMGAEVGDFFPKAQPPLPLESAPVAGPRLDLRDNVLRLGELMVAGWAAELEDRIAAEDEEWQRRMDQMFAAWARTLMEAALADPDPADTSARLKPIMRFMSKLHNYHRFKEITESIPQVEELAGRTG